MRNIQRLLVTLSLLLVGGCDNNVLDRIPRASVYLELNIYTTAIDLVPIPSTKRFIPGEDNMVASTRLGYGGILVANGVDNQFRAFDLACPVEANPTVRIQPTEDNLYAICPTCGSKFVVGDFDASGAPIEGVAREKRFFLRRYNVTPVLSTGAFRIIN